MFGGAGAFAHHHPQAASADTWACTVPLSRAGAQTDSNVRWRHPGADRDLLLARQGGSGSQACKSDKWMRCKQPSSPRRASGSQTCFRVAPCAAHLAGDLTHPICSGPRAL